MTVLEVFSTLFPSSLLTLSYLTSDWKNTSVCIIIHWKISTILLKKLFIGQLELLKCYVSVVCYPRKNWLYFQSSSLTEVNAALHCSLCRKLKWQNIKQLQFCLKQDIDLVKRSEKHVSTYEMLIVFVNWQYKKN